MEIKYIDLDSKKKESRVYYSNLIDFLKTKQKVIRLLVNLRLIVKEQMSWLSTTFYSQPMGKGNCLQIYN